VLQFLVERESEIQSAIRNYLALQGLCLLQNTAPPVNKGKDGWSFRRMPKALPGAACPTTCVRNGQFIGLEMKQARTYHSPKQRVLDRTSCQQAAGTASFDQLRTCKR
jgi:hypothetical protein